MVDCSYGLVMLGAGVWGVSLVFTDGTNMVGNISIMFGMLAVVVTLLVCAWLRSNHIPFTHCSFRSVLLSPKKQ